MSEKFDVVVVGGGPGGYVAAIRAAQLGLVTAVVEAEHLGGICLNWGCIPTKALLHGATIAETLRTMKTFGFSAEKISFDIGALVTHSRSVASRLAEGVEFLMRKHSIQVFRGRARISAKGTLDVASDSGSKRDCRLKADHIILATGAHPRGVAGIQPDKSKIWSYHEAMVPSTLPKSILIIGAGAIGMEFASLYADLGSDVTIVEMAEQVLPGEDAEIAAFAAESFRSRGIDVRVGSTVIDVDTSGDQAHCTLETGSAMCSLAVERVLLAAGVEGNIQDLGLEKLKVITRNSFIVVDGWGRTNVAGVYAVGDVTGPPCLAHKASHQGIVCVERLAGVATVESLQAERVPRATYCRPQIASIGLSEQEARRRQRSIKIGRFDLNANGKAQAMNDSAGFVKTVFDAITGELLGAHMVGPEVTELIQVFGVAQSVEATEDDLIHTIFAHPTLSEAIHESVLDAQGRALHS